MLSQDNKILLVEIKALIDKNHDDLMYSVETKLIEPLLNKVSSLKMKTSFYESELKRNNIVIYGVKECEGESFQQLKTTILHILNNLLQVNINMFEIDHIYRLGKRKPSTSRPILIKFVTQWRKDEVQRQAGKLKGSGIYLDQDLTKEQIERRRQRVKEMMELRKQGCHAIVKSDKLIVNGKEMKEEAAEIEEGMIQVPIQGEVMQSTETETSEERSSIENGESNLLITKVKQKKYKQQHKSPKRKRKSKARHK